MSSKESLTVFRQIMAILCCLFGLPGNILTIIVCIRALYHRTINFQKKVFHLYLVEISILDTCLLLYWVSDTLVAYLFEVKKIEFFSLMHFSAFSCYTSHIINRLCAALCSWLITCFTFIRFINIFRQFDTIKSNLILLTSLIVIFTLANSYSFILLEYDPSRKTLFNETSTNLTRFDLQPACTIQSEYANDSLTLLINILVAGVLNLAVPSILILIVNITMICYIKRVYSTQTYDHPMKRRSDATNYRSTRSTLLVISMTYTLSYLPYVIFYFLMIILEDRHGILHSCSEVAYILRHLSHSVNFYAYIFTNLRFRHEILAILRYLCRPCWKLKQRQRYKQKKKTQLIILDKCRLPPPPPTIRVTLSGKIERPICAQLEVDNQQPDSSDRDIEVNI